MKKGVDEIIEELLGHPGTLTDTDWRSRRPLRIAIEERKCDYVKILLEAKADPNYRSSMYDWPMIQIAVDNDEGECIRLLVKHGAKLEEEINRTEKLVHLAVDNFSFDSLKTLLSLGMPFNKRNYYGYTPLEVALSGRENQCAPLLLDVGAYYRKNMAYPEWATQLIEKRRNLKTTLRVFIGLGKRRLFDLNKDMATYIAVLVWQNRDYS